MAKLAAAADVLEMGTENEPFAVGYATHVGCVREYNEDNHMIRSELGLWVVADGMGGHECGEIASAITVARIVAAVEQGRNLTESLQEAHRAVINAGDTGEGKPGMGSTVVVLKITGKQYEVAWLGDSRVYLGNRYAFQRLTRDHSYVQQLLDSHVIDEQDARYHPMRHVVSQAIGHVDNQNITADSVIGTLRPGDKFLLCSDGLTDEVSDEQISEILQASEDLQYTADQLVSAALSNGGRDNVTVLLVGEPVDD